MIVNWQFNANQYEPKQGMEGHPPALKIPFTITSTAIVETKDKTGGMLVVDFTSTMGTVTHRYNINNASPKAVEIAYQQLSALCRAVNIYQIDGQNECAALRGGKGLMDVGYQKGEEPDPNFPDRKGYTELKKVYDMAGNEPGKSSTQAQPQASQQAQPAGNVGNWGNGQAQPNAAQQPPNGWQGPGNNAAPQQNAQPQQQGQPGQAWSPGNAAPGGTPPWGSR